MAENYGWHRRERGIQWLEVQTTMATTNPLPAALTANDPVIERMEDQLRYYSKKSGAARVAFKRIKFVEIVSAAVIPFLTPQPWHYMSYVIGSLGVIITVLEGILHLNQYQEHWTSYRNTAESLKHEKFLFQAKAGPYANAVDPRAALAERVEALISQENTQWVATLQKSHEPTSVK
jgi:uncharacterized protein DUF4231